MQSRGSSNRLSPLPLRSPIASSLVLAMLAATAALYVAGRLWQESRNRVYLLQELNRNTSQVRTVLTVDDSLKWVDCRDQRKRLSDLETELAEARQTGYDAKFPSNTGGAHKRMSVVIGIMSGFGGKNNRDMVRQTWLPTGASLKKMEEDKGILVRFVIGRSANRGDSSDRAVDNENQHTKDFLILDNHVEASEELSKKTKLFFVHAAETWDAEFYAKVNDVIYVNIDALGAMLATHWNMPRVYIGCMKSGEVFSNSSHRWYEPDWWKFGDGKAYFRHASGDMYVVSRALAQFISINRAALSIYSHEDVSFGSWMIGLDVKHIDDGRLCCSSLSSLEPICSSSVS